MENTLTPPRQSVSKPTTMNWPDAMRQVLNGKKVARVEWGNKDYCLMKDGWLKIFTKDGFHTWLVSEADMVDTQDWTVVEQKAEEPIDIEPN